MEVEAEDVILNIEGAAFRRSEHKSLREAFDRVVVSLQARGEGSGKDKEPIAKIG